jgi:cytochrome c-type protein NapC
VVTLACAFVGVVLLAIAVRPTILSTGGGRLFGLVALAALPIGVGMLGVGEHVDKATSTEFCLSCHPMEKHGKSLHVDDPTHLVGSHFINGRVPKERACYSCHTSYTMFGDVKAKLRGLKHVYVQYLGTVPDKLALYEPYNNRECLHCHEGTRGFSDGTTHNDEGQIAKIRSNELSCVKSGCHATVHDVANVDKAPMWPKPKEATK